MRKLLKDPVALGRLMISAAGLLVTCLACQSSPVPNSSPSSGEVGVLEPPGRILFVLSAAPEQRLRNGKVRKTGFFLGEFYEAHRALEKAGYQTVIATPEGKPPVVDPESLKPKYWENEGEALSAVDFVKGDRRFAEPLSLEDVATQQVDYQGLVVPGGQGVMVDLLEDKRLHRLILEMAKRRRAIGLICHAPAILTRLPLAENPLAQRRVTSVSPFEEFFIETFVMGGEAEERKIGRSLEKLGYDYDSALPKANYAIRDGYLVTSQNPFSGNAFNDAFLPAVEAARYSKRR